MKIKIIAIGNSKGVRLPKSVLEFCAIDKAAYLEVEPDRIILRPVHKKPRKNWANQFNVMHEHKDDQLLISDTLDIHIDDWQW